jgi:hypothetical protein
MTIPTAPAAPDTNPSPQRFEARDATCESIREPGHIRFVDAEKAEVLRMDPSGELFWRGRLIECDQDLVDGLREVLSGYVGVSNSCATLANIRALINHYWTEEKVDAREVVVRIETELNRGEAR